MMRAALLLLSFSLAGCTPFPDLGAAVSASAKSAPYPRLAPIDGLLDRANAPGPDVAAIRSGLAGRVGALRARAAGLKRPIVEPAVRARMNAALRRHSG